MIKDPLPNLELGCLGAPYYWVDHKCPLTWIALL